MKIVGSMQSRHSGPICQNCANFQNDPAILEALYPGLKIMSSGYACVRDRDGICTHHQLYLSALDSCPDFAAAGEACSQEEAGKDRFLPE